MLHHYARACRFGHSIARSVHFFVHGLLRADIAHMVDEGLALNFNGLGDSYAVDTT